ncbi:MAG: helix-turn-helix domain-containing protein, partial [Planctomycetota bacterium]
MSWMTQSEAAAALGCSIRTIRRKIRSNSLKARREGRNVLVELDTAGVVPGVSLTRPAPQNAPVSP